LVLGVFGSGGGGLLPGSDLAYLEELLAVFGHDASGIEQVFSGQVVAFEEPACAVAHLVGVCAVEADSVVVDGLLALLLLIGLFAVDGEDSSFQPELVGLDLLADGLGVEHGLSPALFCIGPWSSI
jgi:hypothetical protein